MTTKNRAVRKHIVEYMLSVPPGTKMTASELSEELNVPKEVIGMAVDRSLMFERVYDSAKGAQYIKLTKLADTRLYDNENPGRYRKMADQLWKQGYRLRNGCFVRS